MILHGDCLDVMKTMADDSVDLVFCSPPYEDARQYGIDFRLNGQAWVNWAVERFIECQRVSRGLVCWVIEGKTKNFQWTATPALMMADLHRAGIKLRKPPIFHRNGIPGSGGSEWLRNDYEFIVCSSKGKLPWADNTAMGQPVKYERGGVCSNRLANGDRVAGIKEYAKPKTGIANPGNVIKCKVGGGLMGSPLAHENEAPFPESLVEFFVKSFCPPAGTVLDPFCGSGTTLAVADKLGRRFVAIDIRKCQVKLSSQRINAVTDSCVGSLVSARCGNLEG
jgi:DNA modification methylase